MKFAKREAWRRRCPHGHVDVVERQGETLHSDGPKSRYYCRTCKKQEGRDPHHDVVIDAKTGEEVV